MLKLTKLIPAGLMLLGSLCASADYALVVELADGSFHEYESSEQPVVTFASETVCISAQSMSAQYPRDEFSRFYFKNIESPVVSVEEIESVANFRYINRDLIEVSSGGDDHCATLFDMSGRLISSMPLVDGKAIVDLGSLDAGIYILTSNRQSVKIIRK